MPIPRVVRPHAQAGRTHMSACRCNTLTVKALQKAVFYHAKDGLSDSERRPFATPFAAFRADAGHRHACYPCSCSRPHTACPHGNSRFCRARLLHFSRYSLPSDKTNEPRQCKIKARFSPFYFALRPTCIIFAEDNPRPGTCWQACVQLACVAIA